MAAKLILCFFLIKCFTGVQTTGPGDGHVLQRIFGRKINPRGGTMSGRGLMNVININEVFKPAKIHSDYLLGILQEALSIINKSIDVFKAGFGPVIEGPTLTGEDAEVTEDGYMRLDSSKLQKYDRDVVLAIVAHELAHFYLGHHIPGPDFGLDLHYEEEADRLAGQWGFNIENFRQTCGPATLPSNEEMKLLHKGTDSPSRK